MTETIEEEADRRITEAGTVMDAFDRLITEDRATKAELEAFRREVSEVIMRGIDLRDDARLARFIIPQPDPLVQELTDILEYAGLLNGQEANRNFALKVLDAAKALDRNIKIVEATDEQ